MGVGCCALVSLFQRDVCLAGTAAVVDMLVGEEENQGSSCSSSRLPASLCAHLAVARGCCSQVFHTIHKRPLRSAGSHSPTFQVWVCARSTQGRHGHAYPTTTTAKRQETRAWVQPKTYHRHQVVLKTSEARSRGCYNIHRKAILTLSLQCPETAPAGTCAGSFPLAKSCA